MKQLATSVSRTSVATALPSRRSWLKGLGALLGTGLLAAPSTLLAAPAAAPLPASAAVGGTEYIGMVLLLPGTTVPEGWALCDGRVLPAAEHPALLAVLGATYGGDGRHHFALPDLRKDMAAWAGLAAAQAPGGVPIGRLCVIKVANAPAIAGAGAELRLLHQRRRAA